MNDPMLLEAGLIPQLPLQQTQSLSDYELSESDSIHSDHSKEEEIVAGDSTSISSAQEDCYASKRLQYEMRKKVYRSNPQSFKQQHEATSLLQAPPRKKQKVMAIEASEKTDEVADQLFSVVTGQLKCALDVEDVKLIQELSPGKAYNMALVDLMRKRLATHGGFIKVKSLDEEVKCLKKIDIAIATEVSNLQNRLSTIEKCILGHQEIERSLKESLTTKQKTCDTEGDRLEQERDELTRKVESLEKRVKEMEEENYKAWYRGYETCKRNVSQCYPNLHWAQIEKEANPTLDHQGDDTTSTS